MLRHPRLLVIAGLFPMAAIAFVRVPLGAYIASTPQYPIPAVRMAAFALRPGFPSPLLLIKGYSPEVLKFSGSHLYEMLPAFHLDVVGYAKNTYYLGQDGLYNGAHLNALPGILDC